MSADEASRLAEMERKESETAQIGAMEKEVSMVLYYIIVFL